jgi:hypothetical protein
MMKQESSQKLASDSTEAQKIADALLSKNKEVASVKTRDKAKVKNLDMHVRSDKELAEDLKRNSCKNRFYYRAKNEDEHIVRVNTTYVNLLTNMREDFNSTVARVAIDDVLRAELLKHQHVAFTSRSIVDILQICGASYTDSIRNAIKYLATLQYVHYRASKLDAQYAKTKKVFVLNIKHATFADIIETFTTEQKQKLVDKMAENQAERQAAKTERKANRTEMEQWFKDNGIDSAKIHSYIGFGQGKGGHRGNINQ